MLTRHGLARTMFPRKMQEHAVLGSFVGYLLPLVGCLCGGLSCKTQGIHSDFPAPPQAAKAPSFPKPQRPYSNSTCNFNYSLKPQKPGGRQRKRQTLASWRPEAIRILRRQLLSDDAQGSPLYSVVLSNELLDEFDPVRLRCCWSGL